MAMLKNFIFPIVVLALSMDGLRASEISVENINDQPATTHSIQDITKALNAGEDYCLKGKTITFSSDAKISWCGEGNLLIQAHEDIVFESDSHIESTGKGGLLLSCDFFGGNQSPGTKGGRIIFKDSQGNELTLDNLSKDQNSQPFIDFSKGEGAIYLLYTPLKEDGVKQYCDKNFWEYFIKTNKKNFFEPFVRIKSSNDLPQNDEDFFRNYVLDGEKRLEVHRCRPTLSYEFKGYFLLDEHCLSGVIKPYCDTFSSLKVAFLRFFFNRNDGDTRQILNINVYGSPLLEKNDRKLFQNAGLDKLDGEDLNLNEEGFDDFTSLIDHKGRTLLHIVARDNKEENLKTIINSCENANLMVNGKCMSMLGFILNRKDFQGNTPLMLAVKHGNQRLVSDLYNLCVDHFIQPSVGILQEAFRDREKITQEIGQYLDTLQEQPVNLSPYWRAFPSSKDGIRFDRNYQMAVINRFFNREPSSERLKNFYENYAKGSTCNLNGIPSRSRIMLFRKLINEKKIKKFIINFRVGDAIFNVKHLPENANDQPGNILISPRYKHKSINDNLNKRGENFLTKLTNLLRCARVSGNPITPSMLIGEMEYDNIGLACEDSGFFNSIQFIFDWEVARRLIEGDIYKDLPVAVSLARHYTLCQLPGSGRRFIDVLGPNPDEESYLFGKDDRDGFSRELDASYHAYFKAHPNYRRIKEPNDLSEISVWQVNHPTGGLIVARPEQLHQELLDQYGGGYESDGRDYNNLIQE